MEKERMIEKTIYNAFDAHLHLRDGQMLKNVIGYTTYKFAAALIMPNLDPPVVTTKQVNDYRKRIISAIVQETDFTPFMTTYLTENSDAHDITIGFNEKVFIAGKLYPPHGTTHSAHGVADLKKINNVLSTMEEIGMTLCIHGEMPPNSGIDIFDREKVFIEKKLIPLMAKFPKLKIVLEHVSTKEAVDFVKQGPENIRGTITPQHLLFDRNSIFENGLQPDMYCLPILKRDINKQAIQQVVLDGNKKFGLGTDSAPHLKENKYKACGCAGVFNAPIALEAYFGFFYKNNIVEKFQAFASDNMMSFYKISLPYEKATCIEKTKFCVPQESDGVTFFLAGQELEWFAQGQTRGSD